jgi:hypothetical protein
MMDAMLDASKEVIMDAMNVIPLIAATSDGYAED